MKIAVFAPIPSATVSNIVIVIPGFLPSMRKLKRRFCSRVCISDSLPCEYTPANSLPRNASSGSTFAAGRTGNQRNRRRRLCVSLFGDPQQTFLPLEEPMLADMRDALRQLRKAPGFALTAIITLALGIGATTAIFTLVHQVMLKSLPVVKPEELWRIGDKIRCCNWGGYVQGSDGNFALFSWEMYKHFRAHTPEFSDLAALQAGNAPLGVRRAGSQAAADTRNGQYVSGNFFRTLGINPWIGRMMTDADDRQGAPLVAVMSYRIWKEKYGGDPTVVGAGYQFNGHPFTVIGVGPPGFYGARLGDGSTPDIWLPLTSELIIDGEVDASSGQMDVSRPAGPCAAGGNPTQLEAKLRVEFPDWLASHVPMQPGEKQLWQQNTLHLAPGDAGSRRCAISIRTG